MRENGKVKEKGKKYLLAVVFLLAIVSSIVVAVKLTGGFSTFGLSKTELISDNSESAGQPETVDSISLYAENSDSDKTTTTSLTNPYSQISASSVSTLQNAQVASGNNFEIVLKTDGTVWTWGHNNYGQIGNGKIEAVSSSNPTQVLGVNGEGYLENIKQISAGAYSGYALTQDGKVLAWGRNTYGQLGNNSTKDSGTPVYVKNKYKLQTKMEIQLQDMKI